MSGEEYSPKRQKIEMEPESKGPILEGSKDDNTVSETTVDMSNILITIKPEAPCLEAFLESPDKYRPREEFLRATLGEVY
jgi:hypothetical protein